MKTIRVHSTLISYFLTEYFVSFCYLKCLISLCSPSGTASSPAW